MIVSKTPLRMSFAGGGSDLQAYYSQSSGAVLSTTIDKYVYVLVNKKFDNYIRIGYSQTEYVRDINEIGHNIIRETLKKLNFRDPGLDIVYMADVLPKNWGTGLGFSSSLTVGLLNAIYALQGVSTNPEKLAKEACEIEIDILNSPIGKQDQYAAAYGGLNYIKFNKDESVEVEKVTIDESSLGKLSNNLLLFYTGLNSDSNLVLREQKSNTQKKSLVKENLDTMVSLAKELKMSFSSNKFEILGEMLHKGWLSKKTLASQISNSKIDRYYDLARKAGAEGGKILGSGGGGFILIYCLPENQKSVREKLSDLTELHFNFANEGSKIIEV